MKELGMQRKNLKDDLKRLQYKRVLGNSSEGHGYADKRKRKTINRYRKLRKEKVQPSPVSHTQDNQDNEAEDRLPSPNTQKTGSSIPVLGKRLTSGEPIVTNLETSSNGRMKGSKKHRFSKAQREYEARLSQKQQLTQARQEEQAKRTTAMEDYKKKKLNRNKLFSKKTRRGQPIMKHRIDFLLEKLKTEGE